MPICHELPLKSFSLCRYTRHYGSTTRETESYISAAQAGRRGPRRGWILIPVVIIGLAVIGLVVSSFQKEVGLAAPSASGRAAVAAAAGVESVLAADEGYPAFSSALLVALTAHTNMVVGNPADTRLDHLLNGVLDCYSALREGWEAQNDGIWDTAVQGDPRFWMTLHPFLAFEDGAKLGPEDFIARCRSQASGLLAKAIDLAE